MNNPKTALITGCTGQDGSYLAEFLLSKNYNVVGLRRKTSTFNTANIEHILEHPQFKTEWGDVTDSCSLYKIINKYKFDEIYHLAAQSHVRISFDLPETTFDVIAGGTLKLLNIVKELSSQSRIYIASSSEQFGNNSCIPQNEETKFAPASPYAVSKVFSHNISQNYRESYKMFISIGILFNHESERRSPLFVTRKITQAAARIKLGLENNIVLGNLDSKRDWGYTPDYVEGMWLMLQQDEPDDFVLSTGETHTVREFLDETFKLANLDVEKYLKIDERLFRPQEVPILLGDSSKAMAKFGWKPKTKFLDLIKKMYFYDLKQQAKLNNLDLEKIFEEQK